MNTSGFDEEPTARGLQFQDERMIVELPDGRELSLPLEMYPTLREMSPEEREQWEMLGPGIGFDWPEYGLQLSVRGFLEGRREHMEAAMTELRWAPIISHLDEFQRHLAPHAPRLRIHRLNDRRWSYERYREELKTGAFDQYGVYLMFDQSEKLEYVGVAMNSFHNRIWSHDSFLERMLTDVIPIPHAYYFLGLSLEFFLICRLHPPKNTIYRGYTVPKCPHEVSEKKESQNGGKPSETVSRDMPLEEML